MNATPLFTPRSLLAPRPGQPNFKHVAVRLCSKVTNIRPGPLMPMVQWQSLYNKLPSMHDYMPFAYSHVPTCKCRMHSSLHGQFWSGTPVLRRPCSSLQTVTPQEWGPPGCSNCPGVPLTQPAGSASLAGARPKHGHFTHTLAACTSKSLPCAADPAHNHWAAVTLAHALASAPQRIPPPHDDLSHPRNQPMPPCWPAPPKQSSPDACHAYVNTPLSLLQLLQLLLLLQPSRPD